MNDSVLFLQGYLEVSNMKEHKLEFYQSHYDSLKAWSESKGYLESFEWLCPSVGAFKSLWHRHLAIIAKTKHHESPMTRRQKDIELFNRVKEFYDNETSR